MGIVISTLFALALALSLPTEADGWSQVGEHSGVIVFQREGSPAIELSAVGEIDAPPADVQAALLDYNDHPSINKRLGESRVIEHGQASLLVYQLLKLPIVRDRDYTLRVTWREGDVSGLRFCIDPTVGPAATSAAIRMSFMQGGWGIEPIRNGTATRLTYRVQLDFAGSIPRGLVGGGAAKDLPKLYEGLRLLVAERHQLAVAAVGR